MRAIAVCVALAGALVVPSDAAAATTINPTRFDDPVSPGAGCLPTNCSLRQALILADAPATSGPVTINLKAGTYFLQQAVPLQYPDAGKLTTVKGAGARSTTIDGRGLARVITVIEGGNAVLQDVTVTGGVVSANEPVGSGVGGGLYVQGAAALTVNRTTIAGNSAPSDGGGIGVEGSISVANSTISGNLAMSGGSPTGGGIASFSGSTTLINSTISGNRTLDGDGNEDLGGGVAGDDATFVLRGTTIAGNVATTAAAVYLGGTSTANVTHSIVSDTTLATACAGNVAGLADDHSLANDASCGITTANPQIGLLANNGGPTNTHALAFTSPAINAGTTCSLTDQRGRTRDGACDIGAFEFVRPRLTVAKRVVNNHGGTQAPGDFNVHVRTSADVSGSPAPGTASGRTYVLAPGAYTVSEDSDSRYARSFSGSCNSAGAVSLREGTVATCTITNDDKQPTVGTLVNAKPKSGIVRVKLPKRKRFRRLTEGEQLPVGTIVDTLRGRITLYAAANKKGGIAQADFYDGVFKISQTKGRRPITILTLVEKLTGCKASASKASTAAKKKKKRRLWGNGKGRFRTKGKRSAATVVGTKWLVEDRCTSTLTKVARGRVSVRDFVKKKTVIVKKGKRYIARAQ